jgi:hypothetical protein
MSAGYSILGAGLCMYRNFTQRHSDSSHPARANARSLDARTLAAAHSSAAAFSLKPAPLSGVPSYRSQFVSGAPLFHATSGIERTA